MATVMISPVGFLEPDGPHIEILKSAGFEIRYPQNTDLVRGKLSEEEMIAELNGCNAVIAGAEKYSPAVLSELSDLRVISRTGVGYDAINIPAATERKIAVTITPTANHEAAAEQTLALLFGVAKSIVANDQRVRSGTWYRELTSPIRGRTLGIMGMGRIGRSLAVRAQALGMQVITTDAFPPTEFLQEHSIPLVSFEELLSQSDYVSLHCPLNDETRGMINRDIFAKMKRGSVLLNSSRGGLVVEADLYDALKSGQLRAAGLDVFETEPASADNPLFTLDNVVLSPHLAGTDQQSMEDMGVEAARCIAALSKNEWPEGAVVNSELKADWSWELS